MKRLLYCSECQAPIEWETAVANICTCGSRRFTSNKNLGVAPSFPFPLTKDDKDFLRANRIKADE